MIDARTKEKVEILVGERGDKREAAVRRKHLLALVGNLPADTSSRPVNAAPTAEQYNALLADVRQLYAAINALRVLLR